jgi:signal transduction histidine kinase
VNRIVQEALTNCNRHAGPGATVEVGVDCGVAAVEVIVTDDGRGASVGDAGGYGLVGMHERAAAAGGSFSAGPRRGGGWRVSATIPFHTADTATDTASTLVS